MYLLVTFFSFHQDQRGLYNREEQIWEIHVAYSQTEYSFPLILCSLKTVLPVLHMNHGAMGRDHASASVSVCIMGRPANEHNMKGPV
jgi:hypothetical protein